MKEIPITIIGGGAVGCAVANELSSSLDDEIFLIEMNSKIKGENQSSRNSGVIHAGIYYPKKKGPNKARFCVEGNSMLYEFCHKYDIPHKQTGKLVVATNPLEEEYLDEVEQTANDNGVPGVRRISGKEAKAMEPNVRASSALHVPTSGIVEATSLVSRLHALAGSNGVNFVTGHKVVGITPNGAGFKVTITSGDTTERFTTKTLINAAGLYSDEIARMVNPDSPYVMDPVRGEAAKFYQTRESVSMAGMNVYPAPYGILPNGDKLEAPYAVFKEMLAAGKVSKSVGVHLTPTLDYSDGNHKVGTTVTIGPASVGHVGKEDYSPSRDEKYYLERVKAFFPGLKLEDISLHQAGIRAKLKGKEQYDFVVERDKEYSNCINLVGIDSPGLTSSLAIAKHVRNLLEECN